MVSFDDLVVHAVYQQPIIGPVKWKWRNFSAVGSPVWIKVRKLVQHNISITVICWKSKWEPCFEESHFSLLWFVNLYRALLGSLKSQSTENWYPQHATYSAESWPTESRVILTVLASHDVGDDRCAAAVQTTQHATCATHYPAWNFGQRYSRCRINYCIKCDSRWVCV